MKKDILIYGIGKSGLAVENFFKKKGINTILYDDNKEILEAKEIVFKKIRFAVVSPGINESTLVFRSLKEKKIRTISELELGFEKVKGRIIAITGTNGKTTTTSLLGHILKYRNDNVFLAGNIGIPLISLYGKTNKKSMLVCEVSSFQLLNIYKFRPKISVVLNLSPDHLIRHGNFENYVQAKCNIFQKQGKKDYCILNYDDVLTKELHKKTSAKIFYFSTKNQSRNRNFKGVFVVYKKIYYKTDYQIKFIMKTNEINLIGDKNIENVLASILVALLSGVSTEDIYSAVKTFYPLPNRLEKVREIEYTQYVNDSKATNIASAITGVSAFKKTVVLMLGGSDKGENFELLFKNIKKSVHKIIIYGQTREEMSKCAELTNCKHYIVVKTFKEAFKKANEICKQLSKEKKENVLLLSPACASYDEFENYEQRGDVFKELVNKL